MALPSSDKHVNNMHYPSHNWRNISGITNTAVY